MESIAVPWITEHSFSRASAHVFHRATHIPELLEVIELQKSGKHPHRTFTVNLGLFHPAFTTNPAPELSALESAHCARRIRIGHVMAKHFWSHARLWLRYGTGWHWWQILPGDFWWSYRDNDESLSEAMRHALSQVDRYGLPWFARISSLHDAATVFDRSHFAAFESAGFYPAPRNI